MRTTLQSRLQAALGAEFTVERELGGGGMSHTFVARDDVLGRRVVVKLLSDELAVTVSLDRFRREVALSAALQHPHIVPVLRTGEMDGVPYFIMPFVEGESARQRLDTHGPPPVAQTVSILRDVARALAYAHAQGVLHRDIKPDNILLAGGSAVVADFGVAKAIDSARLRDASTTMAHGTLTHQGMSLGTPAYMSPEQISGDPTIDPRADIYAFGVTAFELLTGVTPFAGTPSELMRAHLITEPPTVDSKRSGVTSALARLVSDCLHKDPTRRPQTADELIQRLDDPDVMSGAFATATVTSMRATRRRRLWWTTRMIALALAAVMVWRVNARSVALTTAPRPIVTPIAVVPPPPLSALVVLPFVSMSQDSADIELAASLTDDVTSALTRIAGVQVASRTAAIDVLANGGDARQIGDRLRVGSFVEGTLQRDGKQLRVTARLVSTRDGFAVWNQVLDGRITNRMATLDTLARIVVDDLRGVLIPAARTP